MKVASIAPIRETTPPATRSERLQELRDATAAARTLSALAIVDRKFTVARDPESQRFVILVTEKSTGKVMDQFPPEDIVRMLTSLAVKTQQTQGDLVQ